MKSDGKYDALRRDNKKLNGSEHPCLLTRASNFLSVGTTSSLDSVKNAVDQHHETSEHRGADELMLELKSQEEDVRSNNECLTRERERERERALAAQTRSVLNSLLEYCIHRSDTYLA